MRGKKFWAGILISTVCLYIFARGMNWGEVWRILKSINLAYLPLVVAIHMLAYVFRAQRWQYLLLPLKRIKFFNVFSATMIGFMANNILPLRLGEIVKAYTIGQREKISISGSLATVLVERLFDGLVVILFAVGLLWFFPFPAGAADNGLLNPKNLQKIGLGVIGLLGAMVGFRIYFQKFNALLGKLLPSRHAHLHDKISTAVESFVNGFNSQKENLSQGKNLIFVCLYSLLTWVVISISFYSLYPAFDLHLSYASAILLMVVIAVGVAVPSSPGFVGTFHVACSQCLILLGVEPNKSGCFAIILHAIVFVPVTITGLLFAYAENIDLKQIQSMEKSN